MLQVYVWFKYNLDRSTLQPKFHLTRVRTLDLQIMDSTLDVPETHTLTTEPSGIDANEIFFVDGPSSVIK